MLYFDTLPKIITPDQNGQPILLTNIMVRAKLIEELENNPMLFYQYSIQDGDTPEIIADKYYNDSYRYWIILYSNKVLDPLWDWPLDYQMFLNFINEKYATEAAAANQTPFEYTNTTVYAYQKITKTTNLETLTENVVYTNLTQAQYNSLSETTNTYTIPNSPSCKVEITKRILTIFDYEYELNESKRIIKVLNETFVADFERAFEEAMRT
jgi:hypothetical protein